jgi:K+-sensing histidine kinase KdpD
LSPDAPNASVINLLHGVNVESTPAQISTALAAGNLLRAQKRQADDASRPERTKENKRLKKLETVNEQIMKATTEKNNCENMKAQLEAMPTNSTVTKQIGEVTKQIAFWEAKLSDYESYKRGLEAQAPISGSSNGGSSNSTPRSS